MWRCIHITNTKLHSQTDKSKADIWEQKGEWRRGRKKQIEKEKWEEGERAGKASCHGLICLNAAHQQSNLK